MLFRGLLIACLLTGAVGGYALAVGPSVMLGLVKDDLVGVYEQAGGDVSDCKNTPRTLINPSGGMPNCLQSTFKDIRRQIDEMDDMEDESPVGEPPADEPSSD